MSPRQLPDQPHHGDRLVVNAHAHVLREMAGSARIAILLWLTVAMSVAASTVYIWHYLETKPAVGHGLIKLSDVSLERDTGQLHLRSEARIRLPPTVQSGLDSGVPLTFVLDLNVIRPRSFWVDQKIFHGQRHFTLTYYELTRHYRVTEKETGASRNFRSLSSALSGLGQLGRISFVLDDVQAESLQLEGLQATLNLRLLKSALPLPLQPLIRSSWTLASEEHRWPVT